VAYASGTLSVTPSAPLSAGTTYTLTVKGGAGGVADSVGNRMAGDFVSRFTTAPAPDTTLSGPSGLIASTSVTFSFTATSGSGDDQPGAAFQCRLDAAAFADCTSPATWTGLSEGPHAVEVRAWTIEGGADPDPARSSFTVDTTPPAVSGVTPPDGATGVGAAPGVTVTFSEAIDPATLAFTLTASAPSGNTNPVAGSVGYDSATRTATLSPAAPLSAGTTFTATVRGGSAGVADAAGNRMAADRTWRFTTAVPPAPPPVTFSPVADARVEKAHPSTNYGAVDKLKIDAGSDPEVQSYLRFTVSGLSAPVTSAKLRFWVTDGTIDGPAVYPTGNAWAETGPNGITWKNRPAPIGPALDDKGRLPAGAWAEYDVTPQVTGNGTYSFVLAGKVNDALVAWSREHGSNRPQLVVITR
jgi:hypothetical protein